MAFVVEMVAGEPDAPQFRYFSCNWKVWEQTLQLARNCGWQPLGTRTDPGWKNQPIECEKACGNYEPEDQGKIVSLIDAVALADALERASKKPLAVLAENGPVMIWEVMAPEKYRMANAELSAGFLAEFIKFLRKGAFYFYWDD